MISGDPNRPSGGPGGDVRVLTTLPGTLEKGVNQEERQLPIITNEETSDKLYKVYKWYPLVWEPDLSRSDISLGLV